MSQVHLHLIITHLPIIGSVSGALVLAYGLYTKNSQVKNAAYLLFIICAAGAGTAYLTGEGAEDAVEKISAVANNSIEQHEDSAMYSLISLAVLGICATGALLANTYKPSTPSPIPVIIFLLSLVSFALVARTGYLGGQIRHTEIFNSVAGKNNPPLQQTKDEDD